ncbi:hypothetical protein AX16_006898 [Volvariella volvacea WC 439]|nr:hypothetical protein AX16_006898 [Volvariella volvacea WC 439]
MASTQTRWAADPISHPWFKLPSMKRKHSAASSPSSSPGSTHSTLGEDPGDPSDTDSAPPPPTKRRRCHVLEKRLADLTLENTYASGASNSYSTIPFETLDVEPEVIHPADDPQTTPKVHRGHTQPRYQYTQPTQSALFSEELGFPDNTLTISEIDMNGNGTAPGSPYLESMVDPSPYSVEEPIPEVKMKTSSWYEPEPDRIVITDLDSYSDDEDEVETVNDSVNSSSGSTLEISPALLEHIRSRSKASLDPHLTQPPIPESSPSQALVLFRPLKIPVNPPRESGDSQDNKPQEQPRSAMEPAPSESTQPTAQILPFTNSIFPAASTSASASPMDTSPLPSPPPPPIATVPSILSPSQQPFASSSLPTTSPPSINATSYLPSGSFLATNPMLTGTDQATSPFNTLTTQQLPQPAPSIPFFPFQPQPQPQPEFGIALGLGMNTNTPATPFPSFNGGGLPAMNAYMGLTPGVPVDDDDRMDVEP